MLLEILLAVVLGAIIYLFLTKKEEEKLSMGDGWWGKGQKPDSEEDSTVHPFKVETSEAEINYIHRRLDEARFAEPLEDSQFRYGFNSAYLRKVVSYWRNQFNWKKQVELLNKFPQFKTKIEGIDVHFLHVKPSHVPDGQSAQPLLMIHGWPGSVYEFYKIIPLLMDPASHGLSGKHVFEIICPSIPGYGFSEASHKRGFNSVCAARVFYKLMLRLGFHEFYIQGGDWGWLICTNLAQIAPSHVKGMHLNMAGVPAMGFKHLLAILLGQYFPGLFGFQDVDVQQMFPFKAKMLNKLLVESGYAHIQATKPDTAGCGLNDSPVGLAAYILEKFSTWTDPAFQNLEDGGLEKKFTLDDLLTNIMIYWVSGCIVSSMRFYKENLGKGIGVHKHEKVSVQVPTGIATFPNEVLYTPKSWAQQKYVNIVSFNYMPRGGHFAAFEEPELLAADILQFVEKMEKGDLVKKK
ncbi:epoxide hydrolase 1 isoform X2 [Rhineura floridana]|nr:epoxide hydrolase 1 isoform X2 [Rhineura floridana]XP_061481026.1 epoxide hydrolase 1 isoform X2 [Rhineura floridana]XP_061481027.1 epoxide hydrolase 1 isoform X2 [Rhineura floridana]XP_061481028.1 epoxide hydrolase 1 isoform X2 [Rhineura floridana]XP_061481029.1 epoxide hydrolase 1 isoform X2 [Rhineura floridana]